MPINDQFPQGFLSKHSDLSVIRQMKSKKNTVFICILDERRCVIKIYRSSSKDEMKTEVDILKRCEEKIAVPTVYEVDLESGVLVMDRLFGKNLIEIAEDPGMGDEEKQEAFKKTGVWLAEFHKGLETDEGIMLRGDATARNFILTDNQQIVGLDFEEARLGDPLHDLGTLCASILGLDPSFSDEWFTLCKHLVQSYDEETAWSTDGLEAYVSGAIRKMGVFRPEDMLLLTFWERKIQQEGLFKKD